MSQGKQGTGSGAAAETLVTSAEPTEGGPVPLLADMLRGAWNGRYLAWRLFRRDLKSEFSNSFFGYLWNFADPLVIALAFFVLRERGLIGSGDLGMPFGAYVVYGLLLLQAFLFSLQKPLTLIRRSQNLVSHVRVAPESLLGADLLRAGFDLFTYLCILLVVGLVSGAIDAGGFMLMALLSPVMVVLGYGIGLLFSTLNVVFGDFERFVRAMTRPLIFICPTFYAPGPDDATLQAVARWNPVAVGMDNLRLLATTGEWHSPERLAVLAAAAVVVALLGWMFFHATMRLVVERA